jgi:hypothetical protein
MVSSTFGLSLLALTLASSATTSLAADASTTIDGLISQYKLNSAFSFPQPSVEVAPGNATLRYLRQNYYLNNNNVCPSSPTQ